MTRLLCRAMMFLALVFAFTPVAQAQPHVYAVGLTADRVGLSEANPTAVLTIWCAINGSSINNFGPSNLLAEVTADIPGSVGHFADASVSGAVSPFSNGPGTEIVGSEGPAISISAIDVFRNLTGAYAPPPEPGPPPRGANELVRAYTFRLTITDFSPRTFNVNVMANGGVIANWQYRPQLALWVPSAGAKLPGAAASISISVGGAPTILSQPVGGEVPQGGSIEMMAAATGSLPHSWQWRHNGIDVINSGRIFGARSPSLAITSFESSDMGLYEAVVTNGYGSATTKAVALSIGPDDPTCQEWSTEFGGPDFTNGTVMAALVFDDGSGQSLFAGGNFRRAGATNSPHIAKWDGYAWRPLANGVNVVGGSTGVFALATHDVDGPGGTPTCLYAAGLFSRIGGEECPAIAQWNGSTWAPLGAGLNGTVRALASFDEDGPGPLLPMLFAAGNLSLTSNDPIVGIARWDGAAWSVVGGGIVGAGGGSGLNVSSLLVHDDGSGPALYAAGDFDTAGGKPARRIARWDGVVWSEVGGGIGVDAQQVLALAEFNDGSGTMLYAAGYFSSAGSADVANIARWNGVAWQPVGAGLPPAGGQDQRINCLRVYDDGIEPRLYAGGYFSPGSGSPVRRLAAWDGTEWADVGDGADGEVFALSVYDRGIGPSLYAFGAFTRVGASTYSPGFAEWTGVSWLPRANGVGGFVSAIESHDDGTGPSLFIGGSFSTVGSAQSRNIAKWNGGVWESLGGDNAGPVGPVYTMTPVDLGAGASSLVVGGSFGTVRTPDSLLVYGIATWDGSSWYDMDGGFRGVRSNVAEVYDTLFIADDSPGGPAQGLYAAGNLEHAGATPARNLALWNGAAWEPFIDVPNNEIYAAAEFDSGSGPRTYVAGLFTSIGGVSASRIAMWNGSAWTSLSSGLNGPVFALAVFNDGTGEALYAGGNFSTAGGAPARGIARWNGAAWSAVRTGSDDPNQNCVVHAFTVFDNGSGPALYAGGQIHLVDRVSVDTVARWDGTQWSRVGANLSCCVRSLASFDDGSGPALYAGGTFPGPLNRVAKFDGVQWQRVSDGFSGEVTSLAVFDDGAGPALYAGGNFEWAYSDGAILRIARLTPDGWESVGAGMPSNGNQFDTYVHTLRIYDDGAGPALYAGGSFNLVGSTPVNRIARWNGADWAEVGGGIAGNSFAAVRTLAIVHDGAEQRLCAGGQFNQVGGVGVSRIARWNGSEWTPLGSGLQGGDWAFSMALFDEDADGPNPPALFVGGSFSSAGDIPASLIARWDGSEWSGVGGGLSPNTGPGGVYSLIVFDDGSGPALFVGGQFTHADGQPASAIAKWNGSEWSPVGGGLFNTGTVPARVSGLAIYDDGAGPALYATGLFVRAGKSTPVNFIARWNGSEWSPVDGGGIGAEGLSLLSNDPFGSGSLYVGGSFATAGPVLASNLARLGPCPPHAELPPCFVDWDGSGTVNSQDFFSFLTDFFSLRADFNVDGNTNSQDFFDFLAGFFSGC